VLVSRIVSGLLAVPGLFIGDTVAQVTSAVTVVALSVVAVVLIVASHAVSRVAELPVPVATGAHADW
jgi:hypothetical protein